MSAFAAVSQGTLGKLIHYPSRGLSCLLVSGVTILFNLLSIKLEHKAGRPRIECYIKTRVSSSRVEDGMRMGTAPSTIEIQLINL